MKTISTLFFLLVLLSHHLNQVSPIDSPNRFTNKDPNRLRAKPRQYYELTLPLPSDRLTPSCTHPILRHSFANTINGPPFSTPYSPPPRCPSPPWSAVTLEFRARCRGEQYDRISALWLGGVEILRTSTAEPTRSGIFWTIRRDVTRYSSVISRSDLNLTVMLENVINAEFTGVYHVEVDLLFYNETAAAAVSGRAKLVEKPADLVIPVGDSGERGFWFRAESELDMKKAAVRFPNNTHRAVLELCVSFHGDDEFWYSNPPNAYAAINGLDTGRANGAYREVFVTVDGVLAGAEFPFPVIFTGGINPLFWEPVVAIGAFDLPTYKVELTPFLGMVLDGKPHKIGIGVSDGISYWLINANLHLWVDRQSPTVQAKSKLELTPMLNIERGSKFRGLDGFFKIKAERSFRSVGWVMWSGGNYTTSFTQHYKLKNTIGYKNGGAHKTVVQKLSVTKDLSTVNERGQTVWRESYRKSYPLKLVTSRLDGKKEGEYVLVTNVSHAVSGKGVGGGEDGLRRFYNGQESGGWMEVKGHSVVSGGAETKQSMSYRDSGGCYSHNVYAKNGKIVGNDTSTQCLATPLLLSST